MKLSDSQITDFQTTLVEFYNNNGRQQLPWRQAEAGGSFDPYKIWVSELMLQQTQVNRVIPKYLQFLQTFPNSHVLANAALSDVLIAWQGLGYNRRAKFLWQAAQTIVQDNKGLIPTTLKGLIALPGVGANTAGAIMAYAHNQPVVFIETNIRTVYFHHFFQLQTAIPDTEVIELLAQTLDTKNPREFYWSLMDYGTYLKGQGLGRISQSKQYTKQNTFQGSMRQLRGNTLKHLALRPRTEVELLELLSDDRTHEVLAQLEKEGLISHKLHRYQLA